MILRRLHLFYIFFFFAVTSTYLHALEQPAVSNATDAEQLQLQNELSGVNILLWGLVAGLIVLAFCIRFVARRTTRPCHWCAEFIPKRATVCPRCGRANPFLSQEALNRIAP